MQEYVQEMHQVQTLAKLASRDGWRDGLTGSPEATS
jgi:hypothetical protein